MDVDEEFEDTKKLQLALLQEQFVLTNPDNDKTDQHYKNIVAAIEENKKLLSHLESLKNTLLRLLTECKIAKRKINERRTELMCCVGKDIKHSHISYINCGRPYFKDSDQFPAPENNDVKRIKQMGILDYHSFRPRVPWDNINKKKLKEVMLKHSQDFVMKETKKKMDSISRAVSRKTTNLNQQSKNELQHYNKTLQTLYDQPLESIALPLNEIDKYDWENIAADLGDNHTYKECRSMWRNVLHPSRNNGQWTPEEIKKIRLLINQSGARDWDKLAKDLNTNRSAYQCFVYFKIYILRSLTKGVKWTQEEDEYLESVMNNLRIGNYVSWTKVSYYLENRTKEQIYSRYMCMDKIRHGAYTLEEDAVIRAAVKVYGNRPTQIAALLPGRSKTQVRYRMKRLKSNNVIKHDWTYHEDLHLMKLVKQSISPDFQEISKDFVGKHVYSVRARYYKLMYWLNANHDKTLDDYPRYKMEQTPDENLESALNRLKKSITKTTKKKIGFKPEIRIQRLGIDIDLICYFKNNFKLVKPPQTIKPGNSNEFKDKDIRELKSILQLLGANLNKDKIESIKSQFNDIYKIAKFLLNSPEESQNIVPKIPTIRTYSRKKKVDDVEVKHIPSLNENKPSCSIWNDKSKSIYYYLPPTLSTIKALRMMTLFKYSSLQLNFHPTCDTSSVITSWFDSSLFKMRFDALFLWPNIISNILPGIKLHLFQENQQQICCKEEIEEDPLMIHPWEKAKEQQPYSVSSVQIYNKNDTVSDNDEDIDEVTNMDVKGKIEKLKRKRENNKKKTKTVAKKRK